MFHENLRKSVLLLNFIICFSPILHPLTVYLASDDAPLLHSNYTEAILIYGMDAVGHMCLIFLHLKFFILIAERILAYRKRDVYEHTRNNYVPQIFSAAFALCLIELSLKLYTFLVLDTEERIDISLLKVLTISGSPIYLLVSCLFCYNCGLVGYFCFRRLQITAVGQRHHSRSLSERFELRQTEVVTNIMLSLNKLYIVSLIASSPALFPCIRVIFWPADETWQRIYKTSTLYTYAAIGAYNLVATIYTLKKMKVMFKTIPVEIGVNPRNDNVERYFSRLQTDWKIGAVK
ncbi:unnamed protein product [Bursaphelenchus xylophilus]|uniref:(pine wood nematode) hypothetical protein n=1 Tax=Bursaphelenchus xylophilus TaxID=6326 RepID=A0A1I7RMB6_BURXY|nr:unnamed protein product [Bursaphelenchus xylophilus]CAG9118359.1 unnamed protein product [Bursaphelenchus xylophilus]